MYMYMYVCIYIYIYNNMYGAWRSCSLLPFCRNSPTNC